jgi:TetR/AcrR family transcriptional regulator, cholesterol catabolism regulator
MSTHKTSIPMKASILMQARGLFWKKGYSGTTIKNIATACHCLPGNIYNYFPSKEELLYEVILEEVNVLLNSARDLLNKEASPVEQLRDLIKKHVSITLREVKTADVLFETELRHLPKSKQKEIIELRKEFELILQQIIQRGVDTGEFIECDAQLTSFNIIALVVRTRLWFSPRGRLSVDEVGDTIFDFVLHGIAKK